MKVKTVVTHKGHKERKVRQKLLIVSKEKHHLMRDFILTQQDKCLVTEPSSIVLN